MPQINCTHCGQTYDLTDAQAPQYAGQTINCTKCGKPFTVPGQPAASLPPLGMQPVNYAQPHPGFQQQPNSLAVASLVCGVVGMILPVIPGVLAIIFGIIGLKRTRDPNVGGKGLAIAGISVGAASLLIGLVMGGCMMSILLPSLNRARETANRVKCASNMRQIGQALMLYANENKGEYPPRLEDLLLTQDITSQVFVCPSSNDTPAPGQTPAAQAAALSSSGHLSYIYVPGLNSSSPAEAIVLYEQPTDHGGDGMNMLFGDGHVEFQTKSNAARIIAQIQAGNNPPKLGGQ